MAGVMVDYDALRDLDYPTERLFSSGFNHGDSWAPASACSPPVSSHTYESAWANAGD